MMNQIRRNKISQSLEQLRSSLQAAENTLCELREMQEEERESFENLPENLQQSDKGQTIDQIANDLEEAIDSIESSLQEIENDASNIECALIP
jgi:predicted ribosome quality control (RQC) complex YloA/Tae2 family protein